MMRPRVALPTGTEIGAPVDTTGQTALQTFRCTHRDRAHDTVAELLLHFERERDVLELQRLVHLWDGLARKLDVDDGADDLGDFAFGLSCHS